MIYSSGVAALQNRAKSLLSSTSSNIVSRRIETSDPKELDEMFLISELGLTEDEAPPPAGREDKKPFARPKGPGRKRG